MSNHKIVVDCATNITKAIALTPAEIAQRDQDEANAKQIEAEREAKAKALAETKASALAKLAELGLSEEEAKIIAG